MTKILLTKSLMQGLAHFYYQYRFSYFLPSLDLIPCDSVTGILASLDLVTEPIIGCIVKRYFWIFWTQDSIAIHTMITTRQLKLNEVINQKSFTTERRSTKQAGLGFIIDRHRFTTVGSLPYLEKMQLSQRGQKALQHWPC